MPPISPVIVNMRNSKTVFQNPNSTYLIPENRHFFLWRCLLSCLQSFPSPRLCLHSVFLLSIMQRPNTIPPLCWSTTESRLVCRGGLRIGEDGHLRLARLRFLGSSRWGGWLLRLLFGCITRRGKWICFGSQCWSGFGQCG